MSKKTKIIYVDNSLTNYNGHSSTFAFSLLRTGLISCILSNQSAIFQEEKIKKVFSLSLSSPKISLPDRKASILSFLEALYKIFYANTIFLYDFLKSRMYWSTKENTACTFIIANSESRNIIGIAFAAFFLTDLKFVFYLQRDVQSIFKIVGQITRLLKIKNIYFLTETEIMAKKWSSVLGLPCKSFPFPVEMSTPLHKREENLQKIVFGVLGPPREEKGFSLITQLCEEKNQLELISSSETKLEFIIQTSPVWENCNVSTEVARITSLSQKNSTINLITATMTYEEYQEKLSEIDVLLLPYSVKAYGIRSSGILIEGIANAKILVVTKKTLLSELAHKHNSAVLDIDDGDIDSLMLAIREVVDKHYQLSQNAYTASMKWREKYSPASFLKFVISHTS